MKAQVQVATGRRGDWIPVRHPCGLHCARFPANTFFLGIQIKCDRGCSQEYLGRSLCQNDAQAEEKGEEDEVCPALAERVCCRMGDRKHYKP